jgi:hypothetical protein
MVDGPGLVVAAAGLMVRQHGDNAEGGRPKAEAGQDVAELFGSAFSIQHLALSL